MRLRREPVMISWLRRSLGRHRVDDGFEAGELAFRRRCSTACCMPAKGPTEGSILRMDFMEPSLFDLLELIAEVFEREAVAGEGLFGECSDFVAVERGLGAVR